MTRRAAVPATDAAPPIPPAPSPSAAEPETADDAFAAALAPLGDTSDDLGDGREPETTAPDAEPETAAAATEPAAGEEQPWTLQQARRYRKQADRRLAEASERERTAQAQQTRLEEQLRTLEAREAKHREIEQLLDRDPEAALAALATRAGQDPERWYEQMTIRRANGGQPGGLELLARIDKLEAALSAERGERTKREIEAQQQVVAQQHEGELHEASMRMVGIREHEQMARRWPHAASLPPQELYARARVELASRMARSSGPVVLDEVVDAVEREAKTLAEAVRASKWLGTSTEPAAGTAAAPGVAPARRGRAPSARDAATTGQARELTRAEREAAADVALRSAFGVD